MGRRFVHEKIAELRGKRTQTDLAVALRQKGYGTTQATVSRWESGQAPRGYVLAALADELGVTIDELYADDDEDAAAAMPLAAEHEFIEALRPLAQLFASMDEARKATA